MKPIILASTSPYRKQLLYKLHLNFSCLAPNIDESAFKNESPENLSIRLAQQKAQAIQKKS